jgi:hypothetical protein
MHHVVAFSLQVWMIIRARVAVPELGNVIFTPTYVMNISPWLGVQSLVYEKGVHLGKVDIKVR